MFLGLINQNHRLLISTQELHARDYMQPNCWYVHFTCLNVYTYFLFSKMPLKNVLDLINQNQVVFYSGCLQVDSLCILANLITIQHTWCINSSKCKTNPRISEVCSFHNPQIHTHTPIHTPRPT